VASAQTVATVERLARADRRHAAIVDQWDADLWLLNTPTGIIDLRTGALRPAQRTDYMTRITAVGPGKGCPLWLEFLKRATNGDDEVAAFLQCMCGYGLTGSIREEALFFLYGTGGNGKGTFQSTTMGLMGDYAKTAPIESTSVEVPDQMEHFGVMVPVSLRDRRLKVNSAGRAFPNSQCSCGPSSALKATLVR
jgi:putative DNA primase/helicase